MVPLPVADESESLGPKKRRQEDDAKIPTQMIDFFDEDRTLHTAREMLIDLIPLTTGKGSSGVCPDSFHGPGAFRGRVTAVEVCLEPGAAKSLPRPIGQC
ncbi:hypothetical protein MB46_19445 (plasmid) [Arthrobacter alpinus]|nr:hypothetical protein MB46_19445 [Arthrobacter alpinus]